MQIGVDRRPSQGTPTQEYREYSDDAVYVVSDLHLGGYEEKPRDETSDEEKTRGYRIFCSTDALA